MPDAHRRVARLRQLHLGTPDPDSSLGFATAHCVGKLRLLASVLDRARRYTEKRRDLLIGTVQTAELLEFQEIDMYRFTARAAASTTCHESSSKELNA